MFTIMIGEVDAVPGTAGDLQTHKIATRFLAFVGPFIPFETLCVTSESFEHLGGRTTRHSWAGEKVRLNPWSILIGYLRVWLSIGIVALPFVLYWGQSVHAAQLVPSGCALLALIVVMVVPELLTRTRKRKLTVLRRVVGLGCDPAFRYPWRRDETTEGLMARLGEVQLPSSPETLVDRLSSLDLPARELVFATAWYQSVSNPAWKPLREAAWAKLAAP